MVAFTTTEVMHMIALLANRADDIIADPETNDVLKATAMKCKAACTIETTPHGWTVNVPNFEIIGTRNRRW